MSSAAATAISHPNTSVLLSQIPRVRPPRIPKGTPNANTNPQPPGSVPVGQVWVQGAWRDPASNAAKDRRKVQSRQVEKALRRTSHGMNIYAYSNIRTHQVVYSLTRVLQVGNFFNVVYHCKVLKSY